MWTRKELKERAKAFLKTNYWKALLISGVIVAAESGGGGNGGSNIGSSISRNMQNNQYSSRAGDFFSNFMPYIFPIISIIIMMILFSFVLRIFIGFPLIVGARRYFLKSAENEDNKKCITFAFAGANYMGIVKAMLLTAVLNFLWFLLFIIPGIIKSYSYRMVPYILADNPNIGSKNAIQLSINMTKGQKFDMFILDLSFYGWYILGLMALFIGIFFVMPYYNATQAELYLALRKNAVENNYCSY